MTVAAETPLNTYTANGSTSVFAYTFRIEDESELSVYIDEVLQGSGYSVSGIGANGGGSVTFTENPTSGSIVLFIRKMPTTRTIDYQNSGDFLADTINEDIDRIWLKIQELERNSDYQTLKFSDTEQRTESLNNLPSPVSGAALVWQPDGSINYSTLAYSINEDAIIASGKSSVRALVSSALTDGNYIWIAGFHEPYQIKTGTVTDNNGTILVFTDDSNRYAEKVTAPSLSADFFAKTDVGLQAAIDYINNLGGGTLHISSLFTLDNTVTLCDNLHIIIHPHGVIRKGSSLGAKNLFSATSKSNIKITGQGAIDGRNDTYEPVLADDTVENNIYLYNCSDVIIEGPRFTKPANVAVRINGASGAQSYNIFIQKCKVSDGSKGGLVCRRYGNNIKFLNNVLNNSVDSTYGGATNEKPMEVSGTVGFEMAYNHVEQTNGDGGSIVVEYIDRQSESGSIHHNYCKGQTGGNGIKVGASIDIDVHHNNIFDPGSQAIYIEGCYKTNVHHNHLHNAQKNSIIFINDGDTGRVCIDCEAHHNFFVNCNQAGTSPGSEVASAWANGVTVTQYEIRTSSGNVYQAQSAGTTGATAPTHGSGTASDDNINWLFLGATGTGSVDTYHVRIGGGSTEIRLFKNVYINDDGTSANGVNVGSSTDEYSIENENFLKLSDGVVTFKNTSATNGVIKNCKGAKTRDSGTVTVSSGTNNTLVTPDTVLESTNRVQVTTKEALNASVAYYVAEPDANNQFRVRLRDSSHATTNASADIDFNWEWEAEDANGVFGKTAA